MLRNLFVAPSPFNRRSVIRRTLFLATSRTPEYVTCEKYTGKEEKEIDFPVHGQGVFVFECDNTLRCVFSILNKSGTKGFNVEIDTNRVVVARLGDTTGSTLDIKTNGGLVAKNGAYYWFSLDSQNQRLRFGVGEPRFETIEFEAVFQFKENSKSKEHKMLLESLCKVKIPSDSAAKPLILIRDPVTGKVPPLIKTTDDISIDDIAQNKFLPTSVLSFELQQLYNCISGRNFKLDTDDFPDFVQAIEYSIKTKGKWCYEQLLKKAGEFGKQNPKETYLRITIGENNGESPGVPYVIEIWPVGHYSPIHNHGGANAIIKVLNGEILATNYPYLSTDEDVIRPMFKNILHKGQVTWINSRLNQTHQLYNEKTNFSTAITIQCYLYDKDDQKHYDYFDYITEDVPVEVMKYEPDSDMDFVEFKQLIRKEWDDRRQ